MLDSMQPTALEQKMALLDGAIRTEMGKLGLMFVSGPDTSELTADRALGNPKLRVIPVNHQWRGTYLFSVADRP